MRPLLFDAELDKRGLRATGISFDINYARPHTFALEADKSYEACVQLGVSTNTGDREGRELQRRTVVASDAQIEQALAGLRGEIQQTPPMYSAIKKDGKALYKYAREGIEIERAERSVFIYALELIVRRDTEIDITVTCSKGTYIRVLAQDIGKRLGCGAHLHALRRTGSGALILDAACTLDELATLDEAGRDARLQAADVLLADAPLLRLPAAAAARFLGGVRIRIDQPDAPLLRVYGPQSRAFLGSAHVAAGELISHRLLSPAEVQGLLDSHTLKLTP